MPREKQVWCSGDLGAYRPPRDDRLWQYRHLGKAFYENPTTQKQAVAEFRDALALSPGPARERLNYGLALLKLTGKFLSASREVRIVTNMCVYWDEIFLGEDAAAPEVRLTTLDASAAQLSFRGFSRIQVDPQRKQPEFFDYNTVSSLSNWNPTPGLYTRYGDVRELVQSVDDRLVVMGSGDELQLWYEAAGLPALPAGLDRDYPLLVDGWAKDADVNTAFSQNVEPLPFHGMSSYPYPSRESFPHDEIHRRYREAYNTRPALRLIRPLSP